MRLDTVELHTEFLSRLGQLVAEESDLETKPLEIALGAPLPEKMRLYLYNLTAPPGGRPSGEHKIQLIAPGQSRGDLGNFDFSDDRFIVLAGFSGAEGVYVLWDAVLHQDFSWSANAQVKGETLARAMEEGIAIQERHLRLVEETEVVVVVPAENLVDGLLARAAMSSGAAPTAVLAPSTHGIDYRVASEDTVSSRRRVFEIDPDLFDRATDAHARTQNALRDRILAAGLMPLSPSPGDPQFDIAWIDGDDVRVVEVKSLTHQNEVRQLRYAIGQVLHYCFMLQWPVATTTPVIALERRPSDDIWENLCEEVGIRLVWPATFDDLFE